MIKLSVYEDNAGALILARTLTPKFTPHCKYYATKPILFCENINERKIALLRVTTAEQLGDLLTKGIPRETFK